MQIPLILLLVVQLTVETSSTMSDVTNTTVTPKKRVRKRERDKTGGSGGGGGGGSGGEGRKERKMDKKLNRFMKDQKKTIKQVMRRQKETDSTMSELRTIVDRLGTRGHTLSSGFLTFSLAKWQTDYMPLDSQELKEKLHDVDRIQQADSMHQRELETLNLLNQRMKNLEDDNKRLAARNENLIDEIKRINKKYGRETWSEPTSDMDRRQVYLAGKPAAVVPMIYTNLNIAEKNSVIITGGTLNGTTLSNVLSITIKNQTETAAAWRNVDADLIPLMMHHKITIRELEDLPIPLRYHCSTTYQGQILVLGGFAQEGFPRKQSYGLINGREWRALPEMIYPRAKFGCTTWEERLWVVGGYDRSPLQSTENFDIFQETWQEGPKLIQRRHSAPIVTTTDGLYVIGGRDTHVLESVELLTPNRRRFVERPPLPLAMDGLSATTMGNNVYIVGTTMRDHVSRVLLYKDQTWTKKGKLNTPRHSPIAMAINHELWFIGGCCGVLPGIERLDVKTGMTTTENIDELAERYNFAALYFS